MEKVSILIPCFNAERFIEEAVVSALAQDYPNKEVIVIDDGSTDKSLEVLRNFDNSVRIISRENLGGNPTRNELLKLANGTWIQFLDADDYLPVGKVSQQMDWISKHPGYDVVYGAIMATYDDGTNRRFERQEVIYPDDEWAAMVSWELPQTGSPLFKRDALLDVGGWNNEQRVCQEHELYLRLLKAGKRFVGVREFDQIAHYRLWGENTVSRRSPERTYLMRLSLMESAASFMTSRGIFTDYRKHVYMTWCVLVARGLWPLNRQAAEEFYRRNKNVFPVDKIRSQFISRSFLLMIRVVGFPASEKLAVLLRSIKGRRL